MTLRPRGGYEPFRIADAKESVRMPKYHDAAGKYHDAAGRG